MQKTNNNHPSTSKASPAISTELIKELRDQTGVSIMQCKKALEEAGGDIAKALVILRKSSSGASAKKAERTFKAGTIQAYIHANGTVGAMVELDCETDFVANNEAFKSSGARYRHARDRHQSRRFIRKEDVTEADTKAAREVFQAEVKDKPAAMQAKIVEGKLATYFAEMVLTRSAVHQEPGDHHPGLDRRGCAEIRRKDRGRPLPALQDTRALMCYPILPTIMYTLIAIFYVSLRLWLPWCF